MRVTGFLIEGNDKEEMLLAVQPGSRAMFERLVMREQVENEWIDVPDHSQPSHTEATMAVFNYLHRLWQMSSPLQVLDH
jgi:hypothetical protein